MELSVTVKDVYGNTNVYPDCATSKLLLSLTNNQKCFSDRHIVTLRQLGYKFNVKRSVDF